MMPTMTKKLNDAPRTLQLGYENPFTLCFVPSVAMCCFVFCQKFRLPVGLHSSCSISQTACEKCFTKHHDSGDEAQCTTPYPPPSFLFRSGSTEEPVYSATTDAVAEFAYDHESRINHNPLFRGAIKCCREISQH